MIVTLGQSCHIVGRSRDRSIPWHLSHNRFRISIPFCWFEHEFSLHPVESSVLPVVGALYESMCQQIKQSNHHDLVGRFSYRLICLFCENWLILGLLESYGNDPKRESSTQAEEQCVASWFADHASGIYLCLPEAVQILFDSRIASLTGSNAPYSPLNGLS